MNLSMTSHCDDSFVTCDDIAFGQPFHFLGLICFESVSGSWAVENTVVKIWPWKSWTLKYDHTIRSKNKVSYTKYHVALYEPIVVYCIYPVTTDSHHWLTWCVTLMSATVITKYCIVYDISFINKILSLFVLYCVIGVKESKNDVYTTLSQVHPFPPLFLPLFLFFQVPYPHEEINSLIWLLSSSCGTSDIGKMEENVK